MSTAQLAVHESQIPLAVPELEFTFATPETVVGDLTPRRHSKKLSVPPSKEPPPPPPPAPPSSPLFTLPREIRNKIYTYALTSSTPISWPSTHAPPSGPITAALLLTNRAIHAEASPILYTTNHLIFTHPSDANVFVHCIGSPAHTPLLSTVYFHIVATEIRLWTSYLSSADQSRSLTHDFPNLRQLQIFFLATRHSHQSLFNPHIDPVDGFRQWQYDARLRNLVLALDDKTAAEVKVICSVKVTRTQIDAVRRAYLDKGEVVEDADDREVLRTGMRELFGCSVALELRGEEPRRRLPLLERLAEQG